MHIFGEMTFFLTLFEMHITIESMHTYYYINWKGMKITNWNLQLLLAQTMAVSSLAKFPTTTKIQDTQQGNQQFGIWMSRLETYVVFYFARSPLDILDY